MAQSRTKRTEVTAQRDRISTELLVIIGAVAVLVAGYLGWLLHGALQTTHPVSVTDTFTGRVTSIGDAGDGTLSGCVKRADTGTNACGAFAVLGPAAHRGDTVRVAYEKYRTGSGTGVNGYDLMLIYPQRIG